jgi:WD40 repeat protein
MRAKTFTMGEEIANIRSGGYIIGTGGFRNRMIDGSPVILILLEWSTVRNRTEKRLRVFLSYAHSDGRAAAQVVAAELSRANFEVWWDKARLQAGASWTAAIEGAIDSADVLVALLSKASYVSDICRAEQLRALRKSKRVIPVLLQKDADRPLYIETSQYLPLFDQSDYAKAIASLITSIGGQESAHLDPHYREKYITAPALPANFVARDRELEDLRRRIISDAANRNVAVTAVRAMGGIGKTVLAMALCHDEAVQDAFPDGVIWVPIGRKVSDLELVEHMREVGKALGDDINRYDTLAGCNNQLRTTLRDRAVLLVLDDVWAARDVRYFLTGSRRSKLLLTTRQHEVAQATVAQEFALDLFDTSQARLLLARWSGLPLKRLPAEADEIISECGHLPLALAMVGAIVRNDSQAWKLVLRRLKNADLDKIRIQFPDSPYPDLMKCIEVSVDFLEPPHRARYIDFAVFRADTPIPEKTLATLWELTSDEVAETVGAWFGASLATVDTEQRVLLHDLQLDYIKKRAGDLKQLHATLIDSYRKRCSSSWATVPDDGYSLTWIPYHLAEAGKTAELHALLTDPSWIKRKLAHRPVTNIISDYGYSTNESVQLIREAIELSGHFLAREPTFLRGQLVGRLGFSEDPILQTVVVKADALELSPWLRPSQASLLSPGGPLRATLAAHADDITGLALSADGKICLSASADHTICVWDLSRRSLLRTLEGHTNRVTGVCLLPGTKYATSTSTDGSLCLWDLERGIIVHRKPLRAPATAISAVDSNNVVVGLATGEIVIYDLLRRVVSIVLHEHDGPINSIATSTKGRKGVTASDDDELIMLWDFGHGKLWHILEGHGRAVTSVAISKSGHKGLSGSHDGRVVVWDLAAGKISRVLNTGEDVVTAVGLSRTGQFALIGSGDHSISVWDLAQNGRRLQHLQAHTAAVTAIVLTGDDIALSGSEDRTIRMWDFRRPAAYSDFPRHQGRVSTVASAGDVVLTGADDGTVMSWSPAAGGVRARVLGRHPGQILGLRGRKEYKLGVSVCSQGFVTWWDLTNNIAEGNGELAHWYGSTFRAICAGASLNWFAAVTAEGRLISTDVKRGSWDNLCESEPAKTFSKVALSGDEFTVAASAMDRTIVVLRRAPGSEGFSKRMAVSLDRDSGDVSALWLAEDGRMLFVGTNVGQVMAFDLEGSRRPQVHQMHSDEVSSVRTIGGGRGLVITTSLDQTMKVASSKLQVIAGFGGDSGIVCCTEYANDREFAAGEESGRVHFLDFRHLGTRHRA